MQTTVGVFGGGEYTDVINATPMMNHHVGDNSRPVISSQNSPPFTVELCRENLGVRPCDKRRDIAEYKNMFPSHSNEKRCLPCTFTK